MRIGWVGVSRGLEKSRKRNSLYWIIWLKRVARVFMTLRTPRWSSEALPTELWRYWCVELLFGLYFSLQGCLLFILFLNSILFIMTWCRASEEFLVDNLRPLFNTRLLAFIYFWIQSVHAETRSPLQHDGINSCDYGL